MNNPNIEWNPVGPLPKTLSTARTAAVLARALVVGLPLGEQGLDLTHALLVAVGGALEFVEAQLAWH